ncbi:hypothetical protein HGM15179_018773 [Zosterops borbonicus]|uniref:RNase H type-1 domain-containing protein n=1 Tax=Zosterops borbonicus TaxID=364589 RepID=A0A8K1FYS9_9PASS|nr:hypothetical protein HGM15179_018773 [Zosterops borbonicus]
MNTNDVPYAMLLKEGNVILKTFAVSPGMYLFPTLTDNVSEYDCLQTLEEAYSSRPDLKDMSPQDSDWELHADKNSFMQDGKQMTSYAVTTTDKVIREKALPSNVSSQRMELITSAKYLELSKGKKVKIWTNSGYVVNVVYASEVIWKERGLLTVRGFAHNPGQTWECHKMMFGLPFLTTQHETAAYDIGEMSVKKYVNTIANPLKTCG